jgi:hypothetical protein
MNKLKTAMAGVLLAGFAVQYVAAAPSYVMQHNTSIEEALKYEASADKTITPAKVIRWMLSSRGQTLSAPSPTEFQPIVTVHNGQVRIIAALAYKF